MSRARPRCRVRVAALIAAAIGLSTPATVHAAAPAPRCADATAAATEVSVDRMSRSLVCLLNVARREHGLPVLRLDDRLRAAAGGHARDERDHHFFGHLSSDGGRLRTRARAAGYLAGTQRWMIAEALHWGEGTRSTPADALDELLHSPHHRAILLSPDLCDVGIAVATFQLPGDAPAATYVLDFGHRWT